MSVNFYGLVAGLAFAALGILSNWMRLKTATVRRTSNPDTSPGLRVFKTLMWVGPVIMFVLGYTLIGPILENYVGRH